MPTECDYDTRPATHVFLDRDSSWAGVPARGCAEHTAEEVAAGGRVLTLAAYAELREIA